MSLRKEWTRWLWQTDDPVVFHMEAGRGKRLPSLWCCIWHRGLKWTLLLLIAVNVWHRITLGCQYCVLSYTTMSATATNKTARIQILRGHLTKMAEFWSFWPKTILVFLKMLVIVLIGLKLTDFSHIYVYTFFDVHLWCSWSKMTGLQKNTYKLYIYIWRVHLQKQITPFLTILKNHVFSLCI